MTTFLAYYKQGGLEGQRFFWMDATTSITPTFRSRVTRHPVDNKGQISDHVINENVVIEVKGQVTNAPVLSLSGNFINPDGDRVQEAYTFLINLRNSREPITVVAELATYENCVLTSLSLPQNAQMAEALDITATFEQIRTATVERATIFLTDPQRDDAKKTTDKGQKRTIVRQLPFATKGSGIPRDLQEKLNLGSS